jgi:hypothetical protein
MARDLPSGLLSECSSGWWSGRATAYEADGLKTTPSRTGTEARSCAQRCGGGGRWLTSPALCCSTRRSSEIASRPGLHPPRTCLNSLSRSSATRGQDGTAHVGEDLDGPAHGPSNVPPSASADLTFWRAEPQSSHPPPPAKLKDLKEAARHSHNPRLGSRRALLGPLRAARPSSPCRGAPSQPRPHCGEANARIAEAPDTASEAGSVVWVRELREGSSNGAGASSKRGRPRWLQRLLNSLWRMGGRS